MLDAYVSDMATCGYDAPSPLDLRKEAFHHTDSLELYVIPQVPQASMNDITVDLVGYHRRCPRDTCA